MRKLLRLFPLTLALLLCFVASIGAQELIPDLPPIEDLTPQNIFGQLIEPVYGALVVLSGYLTYLIPGVKKWAPFIRVIAFALVSGLGFYLYGAPFWKLAFTYFVAANVYDGILRNIFKSPKSLPTRAPATASE